VEEKKNVYAFRNNMDSYNNFYFGYMENMFKQKTKIFMCPQIPQEAERWVLEQNNRRRGDLGHIP